MDAEQCLHILIGIRDQLRDGKIIIAAEALEAEIIALRLMIQADSQSGARSEEPPR